jgi:hypothetical protein
MYVSIANGPNVDKPASMTASTMVVRSEELREGSIRPATGKNAETGFGVYISERQNAY